MHNPGVKIPLMDVDIGINQFSAFISTCTQFCPNKPDNFVAWKSIPNVSAVENDAFTVIPPSDLKDNRGDPIYTPISSDFPFNEPPSSCLKCTSSNENPPTIDHLKNSTTIPITSDQQELLSWHYRLGHVSFRHLRLLAENGSIPRRLAKTSAPRCLAFILELHIGNLGKVKVKRIHTFAHLFTTNQEMVQV